MQRCLQHYVWLQAHVAQDCLFQLVPKFHWAYHLAQMCKYQNPKTFWTYRQESWVGSMATVAHSCSHGTKNTKLSESFCEKYLLGLQLRLNQMDMAWDKVNAMTLGQPGAWNKAKQDMWLEKRPCTWPKASWRPGRRPCFDTYITSPLCHQCLHYEQKDVRLPAATTIYMIIKFLYGKNFNNVYGKNVNNVYGKNFNNYWKKTIIIEKKINNYWFFQSPISIIIENFQYPFQ